MIIFVTISQICSIFVQNFSKFTFEWRDDPKEVVDVGNDVTANNDNSNNENNPVEFLGMP